MNNVARTVYGGIYVDASYSDDELLTAEEFGVLIGKDKTSWFSNGSEASSMEDCVEIAGMHNVKYVEGYSFGIGLVNVEKDGEIIKEFRWRIKDTGHKGCKHIIAHGPIMNEDYFRRSVSKYSKRLFGVGSDMTRKGPKAPKKSVVKEPKKKIVQLTIF